ncbi:MAG: hypothetical protein AABY84_00730 [Candidatus Firestonebacteria bacterium]
MKNEFKTIQDELKKQRVAKEDSAKPQKQTSLAENQPVVTPVKHSGRLKEMFKNIMNSSSSEVDSSDLNSSKFSDGSVVERLRQEYKMSQRHFQQEKEELKSYYQNKLMEKEIEIRQETNTKINELKEGFLKDKQKLEEKLAIERKKLVDSYDTQFSRKKNEMESTIGDIRHELELELTTEVKRADTLEKKLLVLTDALKSAEQDSQENEKQLQQERLTLDEERKSIKEAMEKLKQEIKEGEKRRWQEKDNLMNAFKEQLSQREKFLHNSFEEKENAFGVKIKGLQTEIISLNDKIAELQSVLKQSDVIFNEKEKRMQEEIEIHLQTIRTKESEWTSLREKLTFREQQMQNSLQKAEVETKEFKRWAEEEIAEKLSNINEKDLLVSSQKDDLRKQIAQIETLQQMLNSVNDEMKRKNERFQIMIEGRDSEISTLKDDLQKFQFDFEKINKLLIDKEEEIRMFDSKHSDMGRMTKRLEEEKQKLLENLEARIEELNGLRREMIAKETELKGMIRAKDAQIMEMEGRFTKELTKEINTWVEILKMKETNTTE